MSNSEAITLDAPAKINLYLEVLRRRDDGYHDIRSLVAPVSLCDEVLIEKTDGEIETVVDLDPALEGVSSDLFSCSSDNLATQVAEELKKETGYSGGARITVKKKIPVGGGLGGGSADAAAVLNGLNGLWGLDMPREKLAEVGSRLGSDIPALVYGGFVSVEGVGEKVTPLEGELSMWMVIVNPGFSVSTADIYSRCSSGLTSDSIPFSSMCSSLKEGDSETVSKGLFNGLQDTVFKKYPIIEMVADSLCDAGATGVLVSGSGASVFGLARDEEHARQMHEKMQNSPDLHVWSQVARTII